MDKKLHNDQTGVDPKPYTALDELMFDIEGRDSNYMVGLGLDDSLSQFSNVSSQSQLDVTIQSSGDPPQPRSILSPTVPPSAVFATPSEVEGSVIVSVAGKVECRNPNVRNPNYANTKLKSVRISDSFLGL